MERWEGGRTLRAGWQTCRWAGEQVNGTPCQMSRLVQIVRHEDHEHDNDEQNNQGSYAHFLQGICLVESVQEGVFFSTTNYLTMHCCDANHGFN